MHRQYFTILTPPPPKKNKQKKTKRKKTMINVLLLDQIFGHFRISSVKKGVWVNGRVKKKPIKVKASFERLLFP